MKRFLMPAIIGAFILVVGLPIFGQVSLSTAGTAVTQNFDGLGTATFNLTDNTSIPGVYAFRAAGNATPNVFTVDTGSSGTGQFKNYGVAGTNPVTDRALGSLSSGTPGTLNYGVRYVNNTGSAITSLTVTYTGEQWRNGGNVNPQVLAFDFRQAPTVTDLTTGTYTPVAALNFTTPINTATAGALDGNAAANRTTVTSTFRVIIPIGEEVMIRWTDINDTGNDHGLSIDDLSVTPGIATAASSDISGAVRTANGRGIQNAFLMVSGNGLQHPIYAKTSTFGNFNIKNLPSGGTYVISVISKGYTFSIPSRVVSLNEDLTGMEFIANPK